MIYHYRYEIVVPQAGGQDKVVECEDLPIEGVDEASARAYALNYLEGEFPKGLLTELELVGEIEQ